MQFSSWVNKHCSYVDGNRIISLRECVTNNQNHWYFIEPIRLSSQMRNLLIEEW